MQDGRLFMLQTRNGKRTGAAALKVATDMFSEGLVRVVLFYILDVLVSIGSRSWSFVPLLTVWLLWLRMPTPPDPLPLEQGLVPMSCVGVHVPTPCPPTRPRLHAYRHIPNTEHHLPLVPRPCTTRRSALTRLC